MLNKKQRAALLEVYGNNYISYNITYYRYICNSDKTLHKNLLKNYIHFYATANAYRHAASICGAGQAAAILTTNIDYIIQKDENSAVLIGTLEGINVKKLIKDLNIL